GKVVNGEELDSQILQAYMRIGGVDEIELHDFEELFDIKLPKAMEEIYKYKNGSGVLEIFSIQEKQGYRLLPLAGIVELKMHIQNEDIPSNSKPKDKEIQAYSANKKWFPFATYDNASFLMLDFIPSKNGNVGQILEYRFASKEVCFVAEDISEVLKTSLTMINDALNQK
ncbi:SMI1/KNR4 family protein, partial [Breznakia sp. OttesenSCG-928-G09]|nr:SMI1/KNR4 family protein [Breznakia sp. OttesenSCG-928-G09]